MDAHTPKGGAALPPSPPAGTVPERGPEPRPRNPHPLRSIVVFLFLASMLWSLVRGTVNSVAHGRWPGALVALLFLVLFALIAVRSLGRFLSGREEYRRRFLAAGDRVRLRDAAFYAITNSREILESIPADRKRLVKLAFVLIGLPFLLLALSAGFDDLATLALYFLLALGGVNLLISVVASERQERNRLEIELETARQMQMALMPAAAPQLAGYDIAGLCLPAHSVGGDQYDFVWLGRDRHELGIAVVDVSGKGMDAALTAVYTSGAFASQAQHEPEPAFIMRNLNAALRSRRDRRRFVSFLLAVLNAPARTLRSINAGQCRPLLCRDGELSEMSPSGPRFPLGASDAADYRASELSLLPGDRLLFYTDGAIDAENQAEEPFGPARLRAAFRETATAQLPAKDTVERIRERIAAFGAGAEASDDITLVAINVGVAALTGGPA